MEKQLNEKEIAKFIVGKSEFSLVLLNHFVKKFNKVGEIKLHATKTMIGVSNEKRRIAWITQIGKNFIHVVFPFKESYSDNLCFWRIAQVPGDNLQFNHHFRMLYTEDVNEELLYFMKLACAS
ncbi:hypothetical protein [Aurantibacillus circumpalustris]|uniref:hypothetical protein n=1 Tax=Aurantibacillus circumpalustris TaxID=3036359 RepID=UPI00295ABE56|nr:hypothetical protein [Aurantibacillus circumpalustris]